VERLDTLQGDERTRSGSAIGAKPGSAPLSAPIPIPSGDKHVTLPPSSLPGDLQSYRFGIAVFFVSWLRGFVLIEHGQESTFWLVGNR
jgi:hypothetical protein